MSFMSSLKFLAQLTLNDSLCMKHETATFGKDNNVFPIANYLLLEKRQCWRSSFSLCLMVTDVQDTIIFIQSYLIAELSNAKWGPSLFAMQQPMVPTLKCKFPGWQRDSVLHRGQCY